MISIFSVRRIILKYLTLAFLFFLTGILFFSVSWGRILGIFFAVVALCLVSISLFVIRNPSRMAIYKENAIYGPCDGTVVRIKKLQPDERIYGGDTEVWCITIENGLLNNYTRHYPIKGAVEKSFSITKERGSIKSIDLSIKISRYVIALKNEKNDNIVCVDILQEAEWGGIEWNGPAYFSEVGSNVNMGEILGIVPFGSLVEVYFPANYLPLVCLGQTIIGAETPIAEKIHMISSSIMLAE